jgi:hypothetical protein
MAAHYKTGNELATTKRYDLGKQLGDPARTRNFLMMTATPHNGIEEDFQAWLALVDPDRFYGRARAKGSSRGLLKFESGGKGMATRLRGRRQWLSAERG